MSLPVSIVIATKDRPSKLANLFESLRRQGERAEELVVVDASAGDLTRSVCEAAKDCAGRVTYARASDCGAGAQRNEGISLSSEPLVLFVDDDVVLEPDCLAVMHEALRSDAGLGAVSALITNQQYHPLGPVSRRFFAWLNGGDLEDFSGRCIGPAVGLLSWDAPGRGELAPVDWAPATCVIYRREALPRPAFDPFFTGYSFAEDMALSLVVARRWRLANARGARAYHDRVKGEIKCGARHFAAMELVARHYIMVHVLGKDGAADHLRLAAYQFFMLLSLLRTSLGRRILAPSLVGKLQGLPRVIETAWRAGCY